MPRRSGITTDTEVVAVSFDPGRRSDYVDARGSVENTGEAEMNCLFGIKADVDVESRFGVSIPPGGSIRFDSHYLPYGPASGPFTALDVIVQSAALETPTSYRIRYEEGT